MLETIHLYHTNDLHSHFTYWPRIQKLLTERKKWHEDTGDSCYIFDIGDFIDRSHIYSEATLGKGNIQLLNDALYDAITIGNNEGITLSKANLNELYNDAKFDVIVGNLKTENKIPDWAKPYRIYKTANGTKIGVIAATAEFRTYYEPLGWTIEDPLPVLQEIATEIHPLVDILLCMSHLGIHMDEQLAVLCPEIDVIFGSHTHHVLHEGKLVGNTLLTGGGKFGFFVGHTQIQFDENKKCIVDKKTELYRTSDMTPILDEEQFNHILIEKGKALLNHPVFEANHYLNKEWYHHSALSRFFAKGLLQFSKADCALFNAGIFLRDLPKGKVTAYDVHQCLPHPINACVITLTGKELKEVLKIAEQSLDWPRTELKGLGFRGVVLGKILTYGCSINSNGELIVNGKKALESQAYNLVTLDMFTFGYFFPQFKNLSKTYLLPQFLRDILISYGQIYNKSNKS
ncbi:bifunctional metallophosphatase/5'-nucleotidase [Rummeliibacillus pycnus]|uniref:bifunctional metallophosphatase/5'-nucleotidase n=1 Tax=Rummeliibacillus pycnus TaxID=101070 RepID=UPI000C9B8CCD|nr:5'-nucleotidase C-terminal domain-containing protein [Rummeliibacillus pycnus]